MSAQWKRYDPDVDAGQLSDGQEEVSSGVGSFYSQKDDHQREDDIDQSSSRNMLLMTIAMHLFYPHPALLADANDAEDYAIT
jgi:hypothetical protein